MIQIPDCKWPTLPERYSSALKAAVAFILKEYPKTIGIIATGTIIRGTPDPSSDLDLYVIHEDDYRQRVQAFFNSVPAEIFINAPEVIEKYLQEETDEGTPITAHMLGTGVLVAAADPIVKILVQKAKVELLKQSPLPKNLIWRRYELATLFEDATDLSHKDVATSRMILSLVVERMLLYYFTKEGKAQPRLKDLLKELRVPLETTLSH
jgi:predicted nucleotidyltransferase